MLIERYSKERQLRLQSPKDQNGTLCSTQWNPLPCPLPGDEQALQVPEVSSAMSDTCTSHSQPRLRSASCHHWPSPELYPLDTINTNWSTWQTTRVSSQPQRSLPFFLLWGGVIWAPQWEASLNFAIQPSSLSTHSPVWPPGMGPIQAFTRTRATSDPSSLTVAFLSLCPDFFPVTCISPAPAFIQTNTNHTPDSCSVPGGPGSLSSKVCGFVECRRGLKCRIVACLHAPLYLSLGSNQDINNQACSPLVRV